MSSSTRSTNRPRIRILSLTPKWDSSLIPTVIGVKTDGSMRFMGRGLREAAESGVSSWRCESHLILFGPSDGASLDKDVKGLSLPLTT